MWRVLIFLLLIVPDSARAQSKSEAYELQDRCGRRAAEVFAKNFENFKEGGRTHLYTYRNHYSVSMNKCFYVIQHLDYPDGKINEALRELELYNVNENNRIGIYLGIRDGRTTMCEVREKECNSETEWYELVRPYTDG